MKESIARGDKEKKDNLVWLTDLPILKGPRTIYLTSVNVLLWALYAKLAEGIMEYSRK